MLRCALFSLLCGAALAAASPLRVRFVMQHCSRGKNHDALVLLRALRAAHGDVRMTRVEIVADAARKRIELRQLDDADPYSCEATGVLPDDQQTDASGALPEYELNVFVEMQNRHPLRLVTQALSGARHQWLLVNQEYGNADPEAHRLLSAVICKSVHAARVMRAFLGRHEPTQQLAEQVYEVGFTSLPQGGADWGAAVREGGDFGAFLHVAGKSNTKGTKQVLQAWLQHPDWPPLQLLCHCGDLATFNFEGCCRNTWLARFPRERLAAAANLHVIDEEVPAARLAALQAGAGVHLSGWAEVDGEWPWSSGEPGSVGGHGGEGMNDLWGSPTSCLLCTQNLLRGFARQIIPAISPGETTAPIQHARAVTVLPDDNI